MRDGGGAWYTVEAIFKAKVGWLIEITAFIVTIAVGFAAASVFGSWLNWPDAGSVFAVAAMGAFILRALNKRK